MLTNMNFFSTDSHEILSECHMRLSEKSSKLENEITAKLGFLIFYEFYRPGGQEVPNYFPRNCRFEGPGVQRDSQQCQRASFQPDAQPPARATQLCSAAQPAVRAGSAQLNPSVTLAVRARCG